MPFVLDASVTASWYFPDERNAQADKALNALAGDGAIAPTQWWYEIRNVLLLGERRQRSTVQDTTEFLDWLAGLPIGLAPLPRQGDAMEIARRHRLTFYDAVYLELALRERLALATLDLELAAAARAEGIALIE